MRLSRLFQGELFREIFQQLFFILSIILRHFCKINTCFGAASTLHLNQVKRCGKTHPRALKPWSSIPKGTRRNVEDQELEGFLHWSHQLARIRTIKPEFFTSEDIVCVTPLSRLFYISLWCEADREGRVEWKPRTLKIRYFPVDDCDIALMSQELQERGLIELYEVDGKTYAEIPSFKKHQVINNREADSSLPARVKVASKRVSGEGRKEGKGKEGREPPSATRFDDFWATWPKSDRKQDKAKCQEKWVALGLDDIADKIVTDIEFKKLTRKWQDDDGKYIEAPLVYLGNRRWEDDSGGSIASSASAFAGMI